MQHSYAIICKLCCYMKIIDGFINFDMFHQKDVWSKSVFHGWKLPYSLDNVDHNRLC